MSSVCLFSSYSQSGLINTYIRIYLEELENYFDKIIFITNNRSIDTESHDWLLNHKIELLKVGNEGYDFGMWFKAMIKYDLAGYDRIALINDSCVLFQKLDKQFSWFNSNAFDYCGLVSSMRYGYHIQSFFIIMNQKAFSFLLPYLKKNGVINDYRQVIKIYEIGTCQYLISQGLKLGAMYEYLTLNLPINPTFPMLPELLGAGFPMIKKKLLFRQYRPGELWGLMTMNVDIDELKYVKMIKSSNPDSLLLDLDKILKEQGVKNRRTYKLLYHAAMRLVVFLKQFEIMKKIYRVLIHWKHILEGRTNTDS